MKNIETDKFRLLLKGSASALILGSALALSAPALAQDQDAAADEEIEEILVTGSRIRRDEFSSAAPMQVFNIDAARQLGVSSISELLQRSTIANGQQFDATLNTNAGNSNASEAPPTGGVGSANVGLRALGPERTLILVNGRRLGSSSIRGAPAQPDINLLPLNMVERIEVITEGASSIYGADAVAGVINIILRNDFEGMEVTGNVELPQDGGGEIAQFSILTGARGDRASLVFSAEFFERKRVRAGSREPCLRDSLVTDDSTGEVIDTCSNGFFDNSVLDVVNNPNDIFVFYTPGSTDGGIMNWTSSGGLPITPPDGRLPGTNGGSLFTFDPQYNDDNERLNSDLVQPMTRFSAVLQGKVGLDWFGGNEEFFFETYYFNRHAVNIAATEQIFPTIPDVIPQEDANGNIIVDGTGAPILVDNPMNPFPNFPVAPIYTIDALAQVRTIELQHFRAVAGFRGDIPSGALADLNWSYEAFASYDRGVGFQSQPVLNEVNLDLVIDTLRLDADGNAICGTNVLFDFGFRTPQECVVIDWFAPSLFESLANGDATDGRFATQAEEDFLVATRLNRTVVEQFNTALYFTGNVMELPAGNVGMAFGFEYRKDTINSFVEFLGATGNNAAENNLSEGATVGSRDIFDIYAEVNIPLIEGKPMIKYLGVEGAGRYTEESNFGSEITQRARITYRPNDWIQLSGSYGTSFRAPNLRETFLAAQGGGVGGRNDPCSIPAAARVGNVYDPALDTRSATTLQNCIDSGADPTQLGLQASVTIPTTVGGNANDLLPETSRSYTATLQVSPPVSDAFEVDFAVSYFDISIKNTILAPDPIVILARCFNGPANLASPFCDRVNRDATGNTSPLFNFVSNVDGSFVNVGIVTSKGIDVNTRLRFTLENLGDTPVDVTWTTALTFQLERDELIFEDDPLGVDDLNGDFGIPKRRLTSTLSLVRDRFEFLWEIRHLSGTQAQRSILDGSACATGNALSSFVSQSVSFICKAAGRWYNDVALTYRLDSVIFTAGVNNLLDTRPPLISSGAGSNRLNRITSSGYDQFGRTFFFNATAAF